jgi:hypothetical protein
MRIALLILTLWLTGCVVYSGEPGYRQHRHEWSGYGEHHPWGGYD